MLLERSIKGIFERIGNIHVVIIALFIEKLKYLLYTIFYGIIVIGTVTCLLTKPQPQNRLNKNHYPTTSYLSWLAHNAGSIILKNFTLGMRRSDKEDKTPVTISDTDINSMVLSNVCKNFPHIHIIGEEGNREVADAEYTVICDPVDGTIPFSRGIPISTFVISVLKNLQPIAAVIYDPFQKRMWTAERGLGTFLNGKPAQVSQHGSLDRAHICMVWWGGAEYNLNDVCGKLMERHAQVMNPLGIAYHGGLLASGECDATIFPSRKGLETAAMQLIAEEADGKVTDIHGRPMKYGPQGEIEGHVISNGLVHDEILEIIASCQPK